MKATNILFLLSLLTCLVCCRKLAEVKTPDHLVLSDVTFGSDATALSALTGIYSEMAATANTFMNSATTLYGGLAADELTYYTPGTRDEFSKNEISLLNHGTIETLFWNQAYRYIYTANSCMEGAAKSPNLSQATRHLIEGEAKFIRAFSYFYLVNYFGGVPLVTTTDYRSNAGLKRASVDDVYTRIVQDLSDAEQKLSGSYPTGERIRPNRWAASALLARVLLYQGKWVEAERKATDVISQPVYNLSPSLNSVFLKNSVEAIWQLQSVNPVLNTQEGIAIIPATPTALPTYLITPSLYQSFEAGDARKASWIASRTYLNQTIYYPAKYKVGGSNDPQTEYYLVLRLAEQYLIRAEARAQLAALSGALADLNKVRTRAGLPDYSSNVVGDLLTAIEKERRSELFAEWSHRWLDLKRTGRADAVLAPLKGSTWQPTDVLWPLPENQLRLNSNLTQNPGY